jgi:hypothetical protein
MGGVVFSISLTGRGGVGQSDQLGSFLTPMQGPDGTSEPPYGPLLHSVAAQAPLESSSAPGYIQAEINPPSPFTTFETQLDLIPGTGVIASATAGQPGASGNTIVFGYGGDSTFPNGSAFACVRDTNGNWTIQQQLLPGDGAPQGSYGGACAVFGNIAVVTSAVGSGPALYVFVRTGNVWTQIQQFQPPGGPNVAYGIGAMTGNQLFVTGTDQVALTSAVYVYTFISGAYVLVQTLTQGGASDFFGISVSCDGLTLVIGGALTTTGKAFVYTSPGGGIWNLLTTLVGSDTVSGDDFGYGVAVKGTLMCIGARNASVGLVTFAGAAYVFQFIGGTWMQTQKLTAPTSLTLTFFGWATSVFAGNPSWIAVGRPANGNAVVLGAVMFFQGPAIAPVADPFVTLTFKGEKVYTS